MNALWIFIDGIGIGEDDPGKNPFSATDTHYFGFLTGNPDKYSLHTAQMRAVDAILDVPGLPQSATGQTAILTGVNVARQLARHMSGFPTQSLRNVLVEKSILKILTELGYNAVFANAFRDEFFTMTNPRGSATTMAALASGVPLRTIKDLADGQALYQDFTNEQLINRGYSLPILNASDAGKQLARFAQSYDFCLYEYFITDKIAHSQNMKKACGEVRKIDEFISVVLENLDLHTTTLSIISDHGNLEDISTKTHTMNPVPLMVWGPYATRILENVDNIADLAPATIDIFKDQLR